MNVYEKILLVDEISKWSSHFTHILIDFGNEVKRKFIQIILNSEKVEKLNGVVILPIFLFI